MEQQVLSALQQRPLPHRLRLPVLGP